MEETIESKDFYTHHNGSFYCSATVVDGKIVSLYSETGREGGELWTPSFTTNGTLRQCLTSLGRDYGMKFYGAVCKAAYKDNLLPPKQAKAQIKRRDIKCAKNKVARIGKELKKAVGELNMLISS